MSARRAGRLRWRDVALVLVALALIVVLRKAEPSYEEKLAPIVVHGSAKLERVEARNFAVDVRGFKLARAYLVAGPYHDPKPKRVSTSGIWLSLVAEVEALQKPGSVIALSLRTRDGLSTAPAIAHSTTSTLPGAACACAAGHGAWFVELPP